MGDQISPNPNPLRNADGTIQYLFPEDGDYNSIIFQNNGIIENDGVTLSNNTTGTLNNNNGGMLYNDGSSTLNNNGSGTLNNNGGGTLKTEAR